MKIIKKNFILFLAGLVGDFIFLNLRFIRGNLEEILTGEQFLPFRDLFFVFH